MAQSVKKIRPDHLGSPQPPLKNALGIWVKREEFEWESTVLNFQYKHSPYTQRSGAVIDLIVGNMLYEPSVGHRCVHIDHVSVYCL